MDFGFAVSITDGFCNNVFDTGSDVEQEAGRSGRVSSVAPPAWTHSPAHPQPLQVLCTSLNLIQILFFYRIEAHTNLDPIQAFVGGKHWWMWQYWNMNIEQNHMENKFSFKMHQCLLNSQRYRRCIRDDWSLKPMLTMPRFWKRLFPRNPVFVSESVP